MFRPAAQRGYIFMMVVVSLSLLAALALWMGSDTSISNYSTGAHSQREQARYAAEAGLKHALWQANASNCAAYSNVASTNLDTNAQQNYSASFVSNTGSPVAITATGGTSNGSSVRLKRWERVYASPETASLPASADSYIFSNNNNFGSQPMTRILSGSGGQSRALYTFDISNIGTEAEISNASLQLTITKTNALIPLDINAYAVTTAWVENTVSWTTATTSSSWASPGGDYNPEAYASTVVNPGDTGVVSWDITNLARAWQSGLENNGVLLIATAAVDDLLELATKNNSDLALRPKLDISYRCECGRTCSAISCDPHLYTQELKQKAQLSTAGITKPYGTTYIPKNVTIGGHVNTTEGMVLIADEGNRTFKLLNVDGSLIASVGVIGAIKGFAGLSWATGGTWADHVLLLATKGKTIYPHNNQLSKKADISLPSNITAYGISHIGKTKGGVYDDHWLLAGTETLLLIGTRYTAFIVDQAANVVHKFTLPNNMKDPQGIAHIANSDDLLIVDATNNEVVTFNFNGDVLSSYSLNNFASRGVSLAINTDSCEHILSSEADDLYFSLGAWSSCKAVFQDNFEAVSYSGSNGITDWSSQPWLERGESDGAGSGQVYVDASGWLVVSGPNKGVTRQLILSDYQNASLTFLRKRIQLDDAADFITIDISSTGNGGPWTELARYSGPGSDATAVSEEFDITAFISADTWIRFRTATTMGPDDALWIDAVTIQSCP